MKGKMMKISFDMDRCMGHGQCELFAPEIFRIGDDDVVVQLREVDNTDPTEVDAVGVAAKNCPERVISIADVTEDDGG
jgi:ferredoxin